MLQAVNPTRAGLLSPVSSFFLVKAPHCCQNQDEQRGRQLGHGKRVRHTSCA
jgi:hypothetical protein